MYDICANCDLAKSGHTSGISRVPIHLDICGKFYVYTIVSKTSLFMRLVDDPSTNHPAHIVPWTRAHWRWSAHRSWPPRSPGAVRSSAARTSHSWWHSRGDWRCGRSAPVPPVPTGCSCTAAPKQNKPKHLTLFPSRRVFVCVCVCMRGTMCCARPGRTTTSLHT